MLESGAGLTRSPANTFIESMDRAQLDTLVERAVLQKLHRAHRDVPFYRWFYARHGLEPSRISTLDEFRRHVPTLGKRDLLEFQELHPESLTGEHVRQVHLTSGTSGIGRESHIRTQADLANIGAGGAYEFIWGGLRAGDALLLTMPYSQTMAGPHFQANCVAAGLLPVNAFATPSTEERIELLYRFGCAGMVATPSYLHRMTLTARAAGRNPATDLQSLRAIFMSGESYGMEWASATAEFWGVRLYEGWGATQTLGVVLATCEAGCSSTDHTGTFRRGILHGLDHRCLIEVLDPASHEQVAPGEVGEITITTLRTQGMPCIRFRMGDRVRKLADGSCACGRSFSCFEAGTISRLDDMIKVRGMNIWPSAVDEVIFAEPVTDYSGRIYTDDAGRESIELSIEPQIDITDVDDFTARLAQLVRARIGVAVQVRLIAHGSLSEVQFKSRRWRDMRAVQH